MVPEEVSLNGLIMFLKLNADKKSQQTTDAWKGFEKFINYYSSDN